MYACVTGRKLVSSGGRISFLYFDDLGRDNKIKIKVQFDESDLRSHADLRIYAPKLVADRIRSLGIAWRAFRDAVRRY